MEASARTREGETEERTKVQGVTYTLLGTLLGFCLMAGWKDGEERVARAHLGVVCCANA